MARAVALPRHVPSGNFNASAGRDCYGRLDDPGSHRLWPFELFAWAMANMIYMVVVDPKRKLDKHDAEEPPELRFHQGLILPV